MACTDLRESSRILRLFAFELRRWGTAAQASCCLDLSKRFAPALAIERHGCKARIAAICVAAKPATPLLTLRWTLVPGCEPTIHGWLMLRGDPTGGPALGCRG